MNESNNNLERGPNTEAFLSNPEKIAEEIRRALFSGALAPEFVEEHIGSLMEEARNVNNVNNAAVQAEHTIKIDQLRNALLAQLQTIDGSKNNELESVLDKFCEAKKLDLLPLPMDTVRVQDNLQPDWISRDGNFAVKVTLDSVWTYKKTGKNWIPSSLKEY